MPWLAIGVQLGVAQAEGGEVPGLVFAIFLLFNSFGQHGPAVPAGGSLEEPGVAEATYIVLSLTAKSALAWQVHGGALAGG